MKSWPRLAGEARRFEAAVAGERVAAADTRVG